MTIFTRDSEEEALFRSYPHAIYYAQSPSTVSHANSAEFRNINHESLSETFQQPAANRLALSRYSSSRGSTNSFLNEKKIPFDDVIQSHGTGIFTYNGEINRPESNMAAVDGGRYCYNEDHDEYEEDDEEELERKNEWWRIFSFGSSSTGGWKFLQITWRLILSMIVAFLVFYFVTKPPAPKMSIKMAAVHQFELAEGVDNSGVTTKMLMCNFSVDLVIDNKSNLFGLHIHPPFMAISFGNLPFAMTQGRELHAGIDGIEMFKLYVGTKKKPMYGAGRGMQDLLESNKGLPLVLHVSIRSRFHIVWGLIKPKFQHQAECIIVIGRKYDKKHRSQEYMSRCTM